MRVRVRVRGRNRVRVRVRVRVSNTCVGRHLLVTRHIFLEIRNTGKFDLACNTSHTSFHFAKACSSPIRIALRG